LVNGIEIFNEFFVLIEPDQPPNGIEIIEKFWLVHKLKRKSPEILPF